MSYDNLCRLEILQSVLNQMLRTCLAFYRPIPRFHCSRTATMTDGFPMIVKAAWSQTDPLPSARPPQSRI